MIKKNSFSAVLTDLSKAFDCLSHDPLLAKLNDYGFSLQDLRLMQSYLSNRKQKTKINTGFSSWEEILFGVPQGSILGPLLFNIFPSDLLFIMNNVDFASYADNNTPFYVSKDLDEVAFKLQSDSSTLFQSFADYQMKGNPGKCHFICSSNLTLFKMGWQVAKAPSLPPPTTTFSPVTSTNVIICLQNFLTFSFNSFGGRVFLFPVPFISSPK